MKRTKAGTESSPMILRERLERAHASKAPVGLEYEEVGGLLEVALAKVREASDSSQRKIRDLARALHDCSDEKKVAS